VVIGGGYGGISVAKALDGHARVILIEPKDAFHHNVAALRALVRPAWLPRTFLRYDHLLTHGTVVRDRAVMVDVDGVELASGERLVPDYLVLATGSRYPFPAKTDRADSAVAMEHYREAHANLARADRVMLLGAGPVGLELAGEIAAAWPEKRIVLVDQAPEILPGPFRPELRDEVAHQLDELGVERVLGGALTSPPDSEPGEVKEFSVRTATGAVVEADIWFRCYGVEPITNYLVGGLAAARDAAGYLDVTPALRVVGFDRVYALGDIAAIDVNKAAVAGRQAEVVIANITAQLAGEDPPAEYVPGPPALILPLGPERGAGQVPGRDEILEREFVANIKGRDMMVGRYVELLNLPAGE
jgi:NADH dehydrogenase FAD-containing subunit